MNYLDQLKALLPPGSAFRLSGTGSKTFAAMGDELARIGSRVGDLLGEMDPRTATEETIGDWERSVGLPDLLVPVLSTDLEERRVAVIQKLATLGGQTVADFVRLCSLCGYTLADVPLATPMNVTVELFDPVSGDLPDGPVSYRVSALNATGETIASASVTENLVGAGLNISRIAWDAVDGAVTYKVYGRTAGSELFLKEIGSPNTEWLDEGTLTPSGALPTGTPAPIAHRAIERFSTKVLRVGFHCGDRVYGIDWSFTMKLHLVDVSADALSQADFERVVRHATHAHISVLFEYH